MILSSVFVAGVLALPSFAAHAAIHRHHGGAARRFNELEKKDEPTLAKRAFNGRMTYYVAGLGACGVNNVPSDFIVALNSAQYGGGYPGPNCFKSITISYQGKQVQATITDECPTCGYGELDLSQGLFTQFAGTDAGIFDAEWWFNDGTGGGQQPPPQTTTQAPPPPETTTQAPPPPQTTTQPPPPPETTTQAPPPPATTSTTKKEEPTTTSTSSTESSTSTTSSSSSSSSASSTSASPPTSATSSASATPTDGAFDDFDDFVQIALNFGGLVGAAAAIKA